MVERDILGELLGSTQDSPEQTNSVNPLEEVVCSRRGCQMPASWRLLWNNPRIHTPERRKTWLACCDHREWLEDYLASRSLLKEVLPLENTSERKDGHE